MPVVQANGIDVYYEVQGEGEPLVLIPYLAADQACYAFQVADYAKSFTCFSVDLRGAGLSGKPEGRYSTELFADDIAAFMQAAGVERAHVSGLSLGAATGIWLAAKYPDRVASLSLHSAWPASDPFLRTVVESWRIMAQALGSVTDMAIKGIFPWCFTPGAVRGPPGLHRVPGRFRPRQAYAPGGRVSPPVTGGAGPRREDGHWPVVLAPTLITFGRHDLGDLHPLRLTPSPRGSAAARRSSCSRTARTPRSTRTSRRSTSGPWNSCATTPGSAGNPGAGGHGIALPRRARLQVLADLLEGRHPADDPGHRGQDPDQLPDLQAETPQPMLIGIRILGQLGLQFGRWLPWRPRDRRWGPPPRPGTATPGPAHPATAGSPASASRTPSSRTPGCQ